MKRLSVNVLVLDDNDMNCDPKNEKSLETLTISDIGFSALTIKDYGLVVYKGKKGIKILKNIAFNTLGIVR